MRQRRSVAVVVAMVAAMAPTAAGTAASDELRPGSLDPTFGRDGVRTITTEAAPVEIRAITVEPDGRMVLAGRFGVMRLLADGRDDGSFAPPEAPIRHGGWRDVAVDSAGRIVVAGGYPNVTLSRRLSDGRLDPSFGGVGEVTTGLGAPSWASALAIQPDGRIVVVGTTGSSVVVARYTGDGVLDPTFAGDGTMVTDLGASTEARDLVLQADGRIVASVVAARSPVPDYAERDQTFLFRYHADGTLDAAFGEGGRVRAVATGKTSRAALAVDRDGGVLVGLTTDNHGLTIARHKGDGALDTAFGAQGLASAPVTCGQAEVTGIAVQPDGQIVAAGTSGPHMAVVRLDHDGHVDRTFGNAGGVLPLPTPRFDRPASYGSALAQQPDGKVAVGGAARGNGQYPSLESVVVRLTTAGDADAQRSPVPWDNGYWVVGDDGSVLSFGGTASCGSGGRVVAGAATTRTALGYWLAGADGGVFAFGDAPFLGSLGATPLRAPVVGVAATATGDGYWLVAGDGGVFAFGDAPFLGSLGATPLHAPIVGMTADGGRNGYWLLGSDGGVFAFGDAPFLGSWFTASPCCYDTHGVVMYGRRYRAVAIIPG